MVSEATAHYARNQAGPGEWVNVRGVQVLANGSIAVTAGGDGNIILWSMPELKAINTISHPYVQYTTLNSPTWFNVCRSPITHFAMASHAGHAISVVDDRVFLWNLAEQKPHRTYGPDLIGKQLAVDDLIPVVEVEAGRKWKEAYLRDWLYFPHPDLVDNVVRLNRANGRSQIRSIAISPNGEYVAYSDLKGTYVRDWENNDLLFTRGPSLSLAFSNDSNHLALGHESGQIEIWNRERGGVTLNRKLHASHISFASDDHSIFICSGPDILRIAIETGVELDVFTTTTSGVDAQQSVVCPNGLLVGGIWGSRPTRLRLWALR